MDTVSTHTQKKRSISSRKAKHLEICTNPSLYSVEGGHAGFESVHLVHNALPEVAADEIDTTLAFLGYRMDLPLFISCMTGGSAQGHRANQDLARAAQILNIPVGLGSVRILFEHPELLPHFQIKNLAPDVPVMANLGSVEVRERDHGAIADLMKTLEVQSLVVHLNPGQELFQADGDRDFRGLKEAIARLCEESLIPIIVKETGCGIKPELVRELFDSGVDYVDVAGSGGTNWMTVESFRNPEEQREAEEFRNWGIPTAASLEAIKQWNPAGNGPSRILASGGIRTGMDVAKAIVLGADAAGLALPLIRAVHERGVEGVVNEIRYLESVLRKVMLLTGARDLQELGTRPYWLDDSILPAVRSLANMPREEMYSGVG
jgi:isopentenyl-diphosphate delta-isomerase type 2